MLRLLGCGTVVLRSGFDMDKGVLDASFGDGQIKLFDYRAPPSSARIMAFREHKQMVLSIKMQENGKLASGCIDGVVKVCHICLDSTIGSPHVPGLGHLQAVQHVHPGDQPVSCQS